MATVIFVGLIGGLGKLLFIAGGGAIYFGLVFAILHASRRPLRWGMYLALGVLILVNGGLLETPIRQLVTGIQTGADYHVLADAARLPNPYDQPGYVWSPIAVWPLKLLGLIGEPGMWLLHGVWLIALGFPLGVVVGLSWPFWYDLVSGSVMTLIAMLGYLGLRGSRAAAIGFMVMALLIPRPLMVPLVAWLLWKEPWTRPWAAGLFIVNAFAVLATGLGPAWIDRLLHLPGVMENPENLAPSWWIGYAWWPVGLALGSVAFWRGRLGIASVVVQPYVWPYYLLMLVLEWRPKEREPGIGNPVKPTGASSSTYTATSRLRQLLLGGSRR